MMGVREKGHTELFVLAQDERYSHKDRTTKTSRVKIVVDRFDDHSKTTTIEIVQAGGFLINPGEARPPGLL